MPANLPELYDTERGARSPAVLSLRIDETGEALDGQPTFPAAVIAIATALSAGVDLGQMRAHALLMPGTWTAAALSFQVSHDGVTYRDLYNSAAEVTFATAINRAVNLPPDIFNGYRYIKVRSGTAAAPVNQAAAASILVLTRSR